MSTDLHQRLAQVLDRDRRVRAAVARRSVQRTAINNLKRDITRLQEQHAAREALRAAWNHNSTNGHHTEESEEGNQYVNAPGATAAVRAGGQRRPDAWVAGQPWWEPEES